MRVIDVMCPDTFHEDLVPPRVEKVGGVTIFTNAAASADGVEVGRLEMA